MTSVYDESDKGNLNVDLVDEFLANGHQVDVVTPVERRHAKRLDIRRYESLQVIRFPCLNFRGKVNLLEKGLATLSLGYQYRHALTRYLKNADYDVAIYTTLPTTYAPALRKLKKRSGTFCYLLQKDFFPQSAVDLGLLRKGSLAYRLFRRIEKGLYRESDAIGVMSAKNAEYILREESGLAADVVEVCPNSIKPTDVAIVEEAKTGRDNVRARYGIPRDAVVYIYGGNISRAQGIDFIIAIVQAFNQCPDSYLLFVGGGNEAVRLKAAVAEVDNPNVGFLDHMGKMEFDVLLAACDVGLVFLDPRFTIANIPSRTLAHLNMSQPIIAATDEFTDFRGIVESAPLGLWGSSRDLDAFLNNVNTLTRDAELRRTLGHDGRQYLENECNVKLAHDIIVAHLLRPGPVVSKAREEGRERS